MDAISQVSGRAIPFGAKNVDTDIIIPAKWLKTVTREGLGEGAFETIRAQPGNVFDPANEYSYIAEPASTTLAAQIAAEAGPRTTYCQ